ncbi:MAG TPA: aldehyde ferredoxin oxidoreductase N-terminal domain-containing protein, partial [Chloroflexota bacterium]|nr:aldehyde ferredoxin oxidoreductase N-terminal domain-containing protein [Chloroflexota bacterium]
MANGYWNRILRVNLTTGETSIDQPGDDFYRQYVGGRAFIAHYLLTEVPTGIDAFDPENRLVFAPGVVTGVPLPGAGRHSVGAKSPLTGGFGEAEAGGFWGAELKHAGYDGIVISGRAERPVYLWIKEDTVEIRDASHLWGKITGEVEDTIRAELGDKLVRVTQCGPAGENLVRYACVINDLNEVAGRTGLGAVMGSKNLKAVAVRGTMKVPVADNKPLLNTARWVASTLMENHRNFHEFGTGAAMIGKQLEGHLIVRNFREGQFINAEDVRLIDAVAIRDLYRVKMDACFACSVRCKKRVKLEKDQHGYEVDPKYGGPEYETLGAIGTNLDVHDLIALCKANEKLNYLGMDAVSAGCTISWAMECYELGLLTEEDTDGLKLEWGDGKLLVDILDVIAYRQGNFGRLLGEGALRAASAIGRDTEKYVVHVKGLEIAMHDPRAMDRMRDNYPVNPTGGDHTGGAHH